MSLALFTLLVSLWAKPPFELEPSESEFSFDCDGSEVLSYSCLEESDDSEDSTRVSFEGMMNFLFIKDLGAHSLGRNKIIMRSLRFDVISSGEHFKPRLDDF